MAFLKKSAPSSFGETSGNNFKIPEKPSNPLLEFTANDFVITDLENAVTETPDDYKHFASVIIYARNERYRSTGKGEPAHILMTVQDDGGMGFPGGTLDNGESILNGLRRELVEELALDLTKYNVSLSDHLVTHVSKKMKVVVHFFSKEVATAELTEIENNFLNAEERGHEIRGIFRVPLLRLKGGLAGLPIFLVNQFGVNARNQLLYALKNLQLLPDEELRSILKIFDQIQSALKSI